MMIPSTRTILGATAAMVVWLAGAVWAAGQAPPAAPQRPPMSEEVFKNVRVLRGIPVDEFMGTMGIFSAALGMSCEDCHSASDATWENYAHRHQPEKGDGAPDGADDGRDQSGELRGPPGGHLLHLSSRQRTPKVTPSLAALYSPPPSGRAATTSSSRRPERRRRPRFWTSTSRRSAARSGWPASPALSPRAPASATAPRGRTVRSRSTSRRRISAR